MSKPWFVKAATEAIESPLSRVIKKALGSEEKVKRDGAEAA